MKLYIYTGEALSSVVPTGYKREYQPLSKLVEKEHGKILPFLTTERVYFPEGELCPLSQIKMIDLIMAKEKDRRDIQLFTQSPYIIDYSYWYGRKIGAEIKMFNVIYKDPQHINNSEVVFEDPTGENIELIWAALNRALKPIEDLQQEVEGE